MNGNQLPFQNIYFIYWHLTHALLVRFVVEIHNNSQQLKQVEFELKSLADSVAHSQNSHVTYYDMQRMCVIMFYVLFISSFMSYGQLSGIKIYVSNACMHE